MFQPAWPSAAAAARHPYEGSAAHGGAEIITVTRGIAAHPEVLYDMVADITRMGAWSPECYAAAWIDGADRPVVGARFRGRNQLGGSRWSTTAQVVTADRAREFAFFRPGSDGGCTWRYTFAPHAGTGRQTVPVTEVTETLVVHGTIPGHVAERTAALLQNMHHTLAALARAAEAR